MCAGGKAQCAEKKGGEGEWWSVTPIFGEVSREGDMVEEEDGKGK